ncbi:hypothetical protein LCGC14_2672170, partial [marine sediment metagenome]
MCVRNIKTNGRPVSWYGYDFSPLLNWGLRDYGIEGQLGLEKTYQEYIDKLITIFDEVKRVLKDTGSCWVNLGDTYGGSGGAGGDYNEGGLKEGQPRYKGNNMIPKSLIGIP